MIRGAVRNISARGSNACNSRAGSVRQVLRGNGSSTACQRMGSRRELHSHLLKQRQQCQRTLSTRGSPRRVVDTCIPRHQLLQQQQQQHQRRSFFQDSADITTQTYYTPAEEFMLDATAWFVAGAICLSPAHEFDDLDYQNMEDMQDEAQRREQQREDGKRKDVSKNKNNKKRDEDGKKGGHHHH